MIDEAVVVERKALSNTTAPASPSDEQLIRRFQGNGDEQSFLALLQRYQPAIRRFLYTLLGSSEHADLKQEVVLALWQSLPRFAFRSAFVTYLYRICCNVAYRQLRRSSRAQPASHFDEQLRSTEDDHLQQRPSQAADDTLQRSEHTELVQRALQRLKTEDRLIIFLREFESHSVEECATMLNCRSGTVKSQLHRAKKRLAHVLEEEHYEA